MKRHTLVIAASSAALAGLITSCSNHDVTPDIPNDNAIRFAANAELSTRAGDITTNNLKQFNVYAYTGTGTEPSIFMDNVAVTKTASNTWTYSPIKYWPAENVDFYAYAPASWVGASGTINPVKYNNHDAKTDLIYAVASGMNGNSNQANAQVVFNFRHALSKVAVKLSSTNPDLRVEVTNVGLANLKASGEFTFPRHTTSGTASAITTGEWSKLGDTFTYILQMAQTPSDIVVLNDVPNDFSSNGLGGPKYIIPQTLNWRSLGTGEDNYIVVMCSVYDAKTGAKLWPNANTPSENVVEGSTQGDGLLKFPLSTSQFSSWQPGYYYIYNLVINANSEMGTIEFGNPTVDTFVNVETNYM